jgi:hypothetical protein
MILEPHDTWKVLDPSKIQEGMSCERQFFYKYILGWRSTKPNNHLVFGKAWHKAQEHLLLNGYEDRHVLGAFTKFLDEYRKEFPEDTDMEFHPKSPENALKALGKYVERWPRDLAECDILYTEIGGSVMLTEDVMLYFRMDSILKDREGLMYFSREHKTGSRISRQWSDQWLLKVQIGTYTHVMKCLFPPEEVKGVQVSGTFFKKTKIDFERLPVWKTNDHMMVWMWNTLAWVDRLNHNLNVLGDCTEDDQVLMAFPMNTENCTKYFGCPYIDFCQAWPNPLRKCGEPPMGFHVDFWDPREEEVTHKMEL